MGAPDEEWIGGAVLRVMAVVERRVPRPHDREDALQEIVSELLAFASGRAEPWTASDDLLGARIYRRADWRCCRDWLRRERARRKRLRSLAGGSDPGIPAPQASSSLRNLDLSCVHEWIEEIPNHRWQAALRHSYFDHMTSEESAGRLGVRPGTVRADVSHAIEWLYENHWRDVRELFRRGEGEV